MTANPILIIGRGKVSAPLRDYLKWRKIPHRLHHRHQKTPLEKAAKGAAVVFLLIKDDLIADFVRANPCLKGKKLIHFSGSQSFRNILGMHPFMSFSGRRITPQEYEKIYFVSENPAEIRKCLPWLKNPIVKIKPNDKPLYHALCCMGSNFPVILWTKTLEKLNGKFHIPRKAIFDYYRTSLENFIHNPCKSLTGPLVRKDAGTIKSHLKVLRKSEFLNTYSAFLQLGTPKKRMSRSRK